MKTTIALCVAIWTAVLFCNPVLSGNTGGEPGWVLYKTVQGVQVYYQYAECHDNANGLHYEYVYLKFENTNSHAVVVNWTQELWYNGKCETCQGTGDKPLLKLKLLAGQSREGACGSGIPEKMRIFSRFLNYTDKPELTKFDLVNISVSAQ